MNSSGHQIPGIGALRFPLSRSRMLMLFVAVNFIGLGAETFLAHWIDRTIRAHEWIPVLHGPIAGLILLWFVLRTKPTKFEILILLATLASAVAVGVLGAAFHWQRAMLLHDAMPTSLIGWLVFAPPVAGPLAFAGVALIALMAALHETPRGSGNLDLWGMIKFTAPITKTQQLLWLVGLGYASATFSAVLDHARGGFENPTTWIAVVPGIFATVITIALASEREPSKSDYLVFFWTQLMMIGVGVLGHGMHLSADLTPGGELSIERMINHAPVLAPMLFAVIAVFGLISILRPAPAD